MYPTELDRELLFDGITADELDAAAFAFQLSGVERWRDGVRCHDGHGWAQLSVAVDRRTGRTGQVWSYLGHPEQHPLLDARRSGASQAPPVAWKDRRHG